MKYFSELIVIGLSIALSVIVNYFVFTMEGEVWKKTAIESIQKIGQIEKYQVDYENKTVELLNDFSSIRHIREVDSILTKYGI